MLAGTRIKEEIEKGTIRIVPFNEDQLNPSSYNLTLSDTLLVYRRPQRWKKLFYWVMGKKWFLDMKKDNPVEVIKIPKEGYVLEPGCLYLGSTVEYTETKSFFCPYISGRSSAGRLALFVHVTAGLGDPGFRGHWTLEMVVVHPLKIYPNVQICQIVYEPVQGEPRNYCGKYQDQYSLPQQSSMWRDFELKEET